MRYFALLFVLFFLVSCGEPQFSDPKEKKLHEIDSLLLTKDKGIYHGNNEQATELAKKFSESLKQLQALTFTGGKKNRKISLTGEEFLTYCYLNDDSVLFLCHVPQFKRYKGETRDLLTALAWGVAKKLLVNEKKDELKLGIGLRGSLMYGASAIGKISEEPKTQNEVSIDKEIFLEFIQEEVEAENTDSEVEEKAKESQKK